MPFSELIYDNRAIGTETPVIDLTTLDSEGKYHTVAVIVAIVN